MRRTSEAGFTLMEILVTLVVLGMLMVVLSQGMRFGLQAWRMQTRALAARGDLDATDRALRLLVEQMDPGDPFGQTPLMAGTARRVTFLTELPMAAGMMPTRQADVELTVDAHQLVLLWRPHYRVWIVPIPPPQRTVLLGGVDHLDISYWQPPEAPVGGGATVQGAWLDSWTQKVLPRLLRFRIVFDAGSGLTAPDIVAAPMRQRYQS